jgi:hypothetical protein
MIVPCQAGDLLVLRRLRKSYSVLIPQDSHWCAYGKDSTFPIWGQLFFSALRSYIFFSAVRARLLRTLSLRLKALDFCRWSFVYYFHCIGPDYKDNRHCRGFFLLSFVPKTLHLVSRSAELSSITQAIHAAPQIENPIIFCDTFDVPSFVAMF